jgi:protein HOOK3
MSELSQQRREIEAFFSFFSTFNLARPVSAVSDLADGAALFQVLSLVYGSLFSTLDAVFIVPHNSDQNYFRQPARSSSQPSENWVLRFSSLKRLYRLMTQYFADILQKPTSSLDVPDLQAIAKDHSLSATLTMCRLTIVIGVQCEKNKEFIDKIQALSETDQHHLMKAIEQVNHPFFCRIRYQLRQFLGYGQNCGRTWCPRYFRS